MNYCRSDKFELLCSPWEIFKASCNNRLYETAGQTEWGTSSLAFDELIKTGTIQISAIASNSPGEYEQQQQQKNRNQITAAVWPTGRG